MHGLTDPSATSMRLGVSLLSGELNRSILTALARRPLSHHELKAWLVIASATTFHRNLRELLAVKVLSKREERGKRGRVTYALTPGGQGLAGVLAIATRWLHRHPRHAQEPAGPIGWRAFAALAGAWELTLIQQLGGGPLASAELSEAVPGLSPEKAERELARLAGAGIVDPVRGPDRGVRRELSEWGRLGIGVLAAGARWERVHAAGRATPVSVGDVAAGLRGALPLIRLPASASGVLTLAIEAGPADGPGAGAAAVWADVARGRIRSCAVGPAPRPPFAWAHGSIDAWFEAVVDGRAAALQAGGEPGLATSLHQLHERFYIVGD